MSGTNLGLQLRPVIMLASNGKLGRIVFGPAKISILKCRVLMPLMANGSSDGKRLPSPVTLKASRILCQSFKNLLIAVLKNPTFEVSFVLDWNE